MAIKKIIENDDQISIYTTVYPLQYFTERIGGDAVNVQSIYPPGADEHTFDPTQKAYDCTCGCGFILSILDLGLKVL